VPLFRIKINSIVWGEHLNSGLENLASKTKNINLSGGTQHILIPLRHGSPVWQTGRQNHN